MAAVAAASESEQAAAREPTPAPAPACPRATFDPQLFMAARRGDCELLKHLLQLKDEDKEEEECPRATLDPQLFMAARRGDSMHLKHLLQLKDEEAEEDANAVRNGGSLEVTTNPGELRLQVAESEIEADDDRRSPSPSSASHHDDAPPPPPPPPPVEPHDADGVTIQGDSLLHVVAACGDDDNFLKCAEMIYKMESRLLVAPNSKGDTPLHCAASAGNSNMISRLFLLAARDAETSVQALVRRRNNCGETALHHAVRAPHNNEECIDKLMRHDPDLASVLHQDGTSPLYLAISLGKVKIAEHLYNCKTRARDKLSYSGPDGRNVLHAAVPRGQVLHMILEWLIKDAKPREDGPTISTHGVSSGCQARPTTTPGPGTRGSSVPAAAADCLLTQLTSQRDKTQKGCTPLHLAASLNGWPDARLPYTRFPPIRLVSRSAAGALLSVNKSMAYEADDQGSYPIHVAAASNSLGVVEVLLERCPDCATLRDGKGRTVLHVAAEKERYAVVEYVVCGEMPQHLSWIILNAQDSDGNTALHGAVRAGNLAVFNCLFRNPQVCLDVANKDGMTALDLSLTMIPAGLNYRFNPRDIICRSLVTAGAPHGGDRPELFLAKHAPQRDLDKEAKKHTEATQVMGVVTALVATVTFASAFTLPGGYRQADDARAAAGTPVLAGSYAFDAFVLADTLAFICSITATCTLVYAGVPAMDISQRNWYINVSAVLLQSAARSLVAAFGLGLYLVLAPVHDGTASAIAACAIVFASSLYGHMEVGRIIRMATTLRARIGFPLHAVMICLRYIFVKVLAHFWSYAIIFGLPAIRKRVH